VIVCLLGCASFHFSTLEEYYTGGLYLGPFNGISDGSLAIYVFFFTMGIFGNNYFTIKVFGNIQISDLALAGVGISQVVIILLW
jgi:ethanolaminephosphotransferase